MASTEKTPFFSIIISTRNRPSLFETALNSVLNQSFPDKEIIVVVDGSTDSNLAAYKEMEKTLDSIKYFQLAHRPNGHGPSYAMNFGADNATGLYLCFLDDDDYWTDINYLDKVYASLSATNKSVDVHYSQQRAYYADGTQRIENVWIEELIPLVNPHHRNYEDSYFVDTEFMLSTGSFAHLNCSVFRRDFYETLGGMDECIRYEQDRDIYIRSIDSANVILFSTNFMSRHNIPDTAQTNNVSTQIPDIEKKLYQLRVYDKGISLCKTPSVVKFCCKGKVYELKHISNILSDGGDYVGAAHYAKEALVCGLNFRWLAYTLYLILRALFTPNAKSNHKSL